MIGLRFKKKLCSLVFSGTQMTEAHLYGHNVALTSNQTFEKVCKLILPRAQFSFSALTDNGIENLVFSLGCNRLVLIKAGH